MKVIFRGEFVNEHDIDVSDAERSALAEAFRDRKVKAIRIRCVSCNFVDIQVLIENAWIERRIFERRAA